MSRSTIDKINSLDTSLFGSIHSQTTDSDKRALLAVQRCVAEMKGSYCYLEIGSHLGGTLQTHLLDDRCGKIYSIDPRPSQQQDDRQDGTTFHYENNSSARMLELLAKIDPERVNRIQCFDLDASEVPREAIFQRPQILFIDGEHTFKSALSDFMFCLNFADSNAVILFHDCRVVSHAILHACAHLDRIGRPYKAFLLEDNVFAIFLDAFCCESDGYIQSKWKQNEFAFRIQKIGFRLEKILPNFIFQALRSLWKAYRRGFRKK